MCFTLTGRLHTRLVSMAGPMLVSVLFALVSGKHDYLVLFALMLLVGLVLELGCYGWLIGYQPRWLTLLFGLLEFFILKWIVEWPYPLELRLHTRQALEMYVPSWLIGWLTLHLLLPRIWPRWAEDGGELRRYRPHSRRIQAFSWHQVTSRRRDYGTAVGLVLLAALPWLVAAARTPHGYHFTGLLQESVHSAQLHEATVTARTGVMQAPAGMIGLLAGSLRQPVLPIYALCWALGAFAWTLGIGRCTGGRPRRYADWIGWAGLPLLLFPPVWLFFAACLAWLINLRQSEKVSLRCSRRVGVALTLLVGFGWCLALARISAAPLAYVDEPEWQALAWLSQRSPTTVLVLDDSRALVFALGGQTTTSDPTAAELAVLNGESCAKQTVLFRQGSRCVVQLAIP